MANPYELTTFWNSLSLRVDGAIGAMSLSPNGRDAVLAGRRGLFIIDLDDPFTAPRWLHHITSWEVADVQWLPHHGARPSWCISTSNQKALLWDLARPSNNAIQNVLHKHTRAITDINFHPLDPEMLATCSIDTFVYSWDMRTPRRPVGKWAQWRAGATQVKWNHGNPHQLCSSHDHSFYLWDSRKGAEPVLRIENAHGGKINGLDFSGTNDKLISCANDNTVKFWDLGQAVPVADSHDDIRPIVSIHTDYPVARARALPFGKDNCCGIMPVRGGGDAVHIVNFEPAYERGRVLGATASMDAIPDYSFKGHNGSIKDFLWRTQHPHYEGFDSKSPWSEYQLVTWSSQDFDLKLWPHDEQLYDIVNYNPLHQKLLDSLVISDRESESQNPSVVTTPDSEISEDAAFKQPTPMKYTSYATEPPILLSDLAKETNGDVLSTWALFKIKQSQGSQNGSSQLNHLNWISGVRMGRGSTRKGVEGQNVEEDDGPSNLGEEVSIVGHKFPKIRFEKISVSTGNVVLSLRGPSPINPETQEPVEQDTKERKNSTVESVDTAGASKAANTTSVLAAAGVTGSPAQLNPNTTPSTNGPSIPSQNIPKNQSSGPNTTLVQKTSSRPLQLSAVTAGTNTGDNTVSSVVGNNESQEQKLIFIRLEIKFPKMYPFLEGIDRKHNKRSNKLRKANQIRFDIEETHELTASIKKEMLVNLDNIAEFYSNKYNKYCLEPCLRYLLGDKIELNDNLMLEGGNNSSGKDLSEMDNTILIGDEGWVDDLIDQHEAATNFMASVSVSADEEDDYEGDIIPAVNEANARDIENDLANAELPGHAISVDGNIRHDSTPVPKGCGAVWSRTGQLVCFFIPKSAEHESENKTLQKFNIFKFTESGFSVKPSGHHHSHHTSVGSKGVDSDSDFSDGNDRGLMSLSGGEDSDDSSSSGSDSSDMSFSNDWDEMLEDDVPSRSRIPGMFKGTVGFGRKLLAQENAKSSINRTLSGRGTGSNYKSSIHDGSNLRVTRKSKKSSKKAKNIVGIFDLSHLIPDKYDLACDYRVLGDTPDSLARHNCNVALLHGYGELANVWKVVEMILIKDVRLSDSPDIARDLAFFNREGADQFFWGNHPFGHAWLVKELFLYFEKMGNLQMLAMLSCILFENISNMRSNMNGAFSVPIQTPYSALPPHPSLLAMREYGLKSPDFNMSASHSNQLINSPLGSHASRKNSVMSGRESLLSRLIPNSIEQPIRSESPSKVSNLRKVFAGSVPYSESVPTFDLNNMKSSASFDGIKKFPKGIISRKPSRTMQLKKGSALNSGSLQKTKYRQPPTFTIEMKNVDNFDLFENVYSHPLLNDLDPEKIRSYREQYADILYSWGLPFHRIKILKFNYPEESTSTDSSVNSEVFKCNYGFRYRKALNSTQLLLTPVTPIETARKNAWNTRKRNKLHYCSLCSLLISKRVVICTNCEHVLHSHCAASWWSVEDPEESSETLECPTGCGCHCLEQRI